MTTSAWGARSGGRHIVTGRFTVDSAYLSPGEDQIWFSQNIIPPARRDRSSLKASGGGRKSASLRATRSSNLRKRSRPTSDQVEEAATSGTGNAQIGRGPGQICTARGVPFTTKNADRYGASSTGAMAGLSATTRGKTRPGVAGKRVRKMERGMASDDAYIQASLVYHARCYRSQIRARCAVFPLGPVPLLKERSQRLQGTRKAG